MTLSINWTSTARDALQRVEPRRQRARIAAAVERFARTGHGDVRKLRAGDGEMRLRCGSYRITFTVSVTARTLDVLSVFHRQEGY